MRKRVEAVGGEIIPIESLLGTRLMAQKQRLAIFRPIQRDDIAIERVQPQIGALTSSCIADEGSGLPRLITRGEETRIAREWTEPHGDDMALLAIAYGLQRGA